MTARLTWSVILCLCQLLSQVRVTKALRIHVHEDPSIRSESKMFSGYLFKTTYLEISQQSEVRRAISDAVDYWSSTLKARSSVNTIHVGKDCDILTDLLNLIFREAMRWPWHLDWPGLPS